MTGVTLTSSKPWEFIHAFRTSNMHSEHLPSRCTLLSIRLATLLVWCRLAVSFEIDPSFCVAHLQKRRDLIEVSRKVCLLLTSTQIKIHSIFHFVATTESKQDKCNRQPTCVRAYTRLGMYTTVPANWPNDSWLSSGKRPAR